MSYEIFSRIIPVLFPFFLGIFTKQIKLFGIKEGDVLMNMVFYITFPALILLSVSKIDLNLEMILLPLCAAIVVLTMYFVALILKGFLSFKTVTFGAMLVGVMIMNNGFVMPFIIAAYSDEGLARLTMFDFANGLLAFTFVYYQAVKYGSKGKDGTMLSKFLASVPLWALLIGLGLNFAGVNISPTIKAVLLPIGNITIPIVMISLGLFINLKRINPRRMLPGIIIRMVIGFFIGFLLCIFFDLNGIDKKIVLLCASAPIGYNSIVFSTLEGLDKEYAAGLVSFSILIGIITIPVMIILL